MTEQDTKCTSIKDLRTGGGTNVVSQVLEKYQHMEGDENNLYSNNEQESKISEELNNRQMDINSYQPPPMQPQIQPEYPQKVLAPVPEKTLIQKMQHELKEPFLVFLLFVLLNYKYFDKYLAKYVKKLGDDYGELNIYGCLTKAVFASIIFYVANRAIKL